MSSGPRPVVFDTSTLVAGCLTAQGVPHPALLAALAHSIPTASTDTLTELVAVLQRPKFNAWQAREVRLAFIAGHVSSVRRIEPKDRVFACRDPKDDKFLAVAVAAGASWLVSSDDDLLSMVRYREVTILHPRQFLDQFPG